MMHGKTRGAGDVFGGSCNFRELGGYRADEGRRVRRALLYFVALAIGSVGGAAILSLLKTDRTDA